MVYPRHANPFLADRMIKASHSIQVLTDTHLDALPDQGVGHLSCCCRCGGGAPVFVQCEQRGGDEALGESVVGGAGGECWSAKDGETCSPVLFSQPANQSSSMAVDRCGQSIRPGIARMHETNGWGERLRQATKASSNNGIATQADPSAAEACAIACHTTHLEISFRCAAGARQQRQRLGRCGPRRVDRTVGSVSATVPRKAGWATIDP